MQWYWLLMRAALWHTAHALLCIVSGDDSAGFLSLVTLTVDPQIQTQGDFCTMHLTGKFHHRTFNRLEVTVLTKQTDKQTDATAKNIHLAPLCYAGG